jgi:hypothetical protein
MYALITCGKCFITGYILYYSQQVVLFVELTVLQTSFLHYRYCRVWPNLLGKAGYRDIHKEIENGFKDVSRD